MSTRKSSKAFWLGLLIFALGAVAPKAHAAITLVQTTTIDCMAYCGGIHTATFPTPTTAGDLVVVTWAGQSGLTPSMADTANGSYTMAAGTQDVDGRTESDVFYAPNAASTASVSSSASFGTYYLYAYEFSGIATSSVIDATSTNSGATYNPVNNWMNNVTTTHPNDLLISVGQTPAYATFNTSTYQLDATTTPSEIGFFAHGISGGNGDYTFNGNAAGNYGRLSLSSAAFKIATLPDGYSDYRTITTTSTASVASGTQSNFAYLFSGSYPWLAATSSAGRIQNVCTAPNGGQEPCDLIFTTSTPVANGSVWTCGNSLPFESESYLPSSGTVSDWVNVPSVSTGTVIYACYGNQNVKVDQSSPLSTWNGNYYHVWHYANIPTISGLDSTINYNPQALFNTPATSTGQIDGSMTLNGANDS